jgi:hypothetical protein
MLSGSVHVKALRRTLMKLTPGFQLIFGAGINPFKEI